ncbi:MAG: cysteine desulfurase [Saprospiraceae bacterium]|nr:cysteine desulfurase [Saprospiraceae bacterium]
MRIYLDNASTTPVLPEVIELVTKVLTENFGNPSSIHEHGRKAKSIIESSRKIVAKSINASIGEVFFTSSATEANNMILKNAVQDLGIKRIISSPTEHHCVLHSLDYLKKHFNTEIIYLTVDREGSIDYQELENLLKSDDQKSLVSIMHGNNEIGTMTDIIRVGKICLDSNAYFHCDAVQTVGKYPIDVQSAHISFLAGSAHKFHGPKGTGFVFVSNNNILSPFIHGGAQERNMRAGTENISGIAGMSLALDIAIRNMEINRKKTESLKTHFKQQLSKYLFDISYNGRQDEMSMSHVLSVSFPPGPKADMLVMNLDIAGISASSGSACSAGIEEDSHVLQAIGHDRDRKTIRFSFSHFNNLEEVDFVVEQLKTMTPIKTVVAS